MLRVQARIALGLDPYDEPTAHILNYWSTAFYSNWLDMQHESAWAPEDTEDWFIHLERWLDNNSTPYEGGLIGEQTKRDLAPIIGKYIK